MMKEPTMLEAKKFLSPVFPEWKAFWFNKGPVVKSLKEMVAVLPTVPAAMFAIHVNSSKNDVANWAKDVIGDLDLSNELKKAMTPKAAADIFAKRLKQLDSCLVVIPAAPAKKKK